MDIKLFNRNLPQEISSMFLSLKPGL